MTSALDRDGEGPRYPSRPYVPPLLTGLVFLVVSNNLLLKDVVPGCLGICASLLCLGVGVVLARRDRVRAARHVLVASLVFLASSAGCACALAVLDAAEASLSSTPVSSMALAVSSDPTQTQSGWMCRASALLPDGGSATVWVVTPERPSVGDSLRAVGRYSPNGDDEWGRSSRASGIAGRIKAARVLEASPPEGCHGLVARLRERVLDAIDPAGSAGGALLAGLVAGERTELKSQGISDEFAAAGLAHLVAVSGSHLAVFAGIAEGALLAAGVSSRARLALVLASCCGFVVLCGAPASALRALAMLAAARLGKLAGRRGHAPSGLALAGIGMCLANPFCACDLGFQLSVLSVASLSLFSEWFEAIVVAALGLGERRVTLRLPSALRAATSKASRYVLSSVCASLVCQVATLPLVVSSFGRVSLVSILSNLVVGPVFAPLLAMGLAAVCLSWVGGVGLALMGLARGLSGLVVAAVSHLASLPLASVAATAPAWSALLPVVVGAVVLAVWPRPSRRVLRLGFGSLLALVLCVLLRLYVFVPPGVTVLDVGQGDAILIRDGPHVLLVDTGPAGAITPALARQHVAWLDGVVLTHLHDDHAGGVEDLAGLVSCGEVLVGEGVSDDLGALAPDVERLSSRAVGELATGDVICVGNFTLTCLWPDEPSDGSENEDSVCLLLEYRGSGGSLKMLLTGDAEEGVLEKVAPRAGDIDVFKVGHHGSRVSIDADEAAELAPEVSVASAGAGNSYGHPTPECVGVLEGAGSVFLCTVDHGDVTLAPDPAGVRVSCAR